MPSYECADEPRPLAGFLRKGRRVQVQKNSQGTGFVRMRGRTPSLGCFFELGLSALCVKSQESTIHELIHRTIPLLGDLMNALAKAIQDDDLRFSPGLFLSGLKSDKLDGIQVDCQKRIIDRSRQFSDVSRFVPQEFVEGAQEPDVVDSELNASPVGHDSLLSSGWGCRDGRYLAAHTCRYIHHPHSSFKPPPQFRKSVRMSNRDLPNLPALVQNAFGTRAPGARSIKFTVLIANQALASQGKER